MTASREETRVCPRSHPSAPHNMYRDETHDFIWYCPMERAAERAEAYRLEREAIERAERIETLAAAIREIDGAHDMGAGALAEALVDRGWKQ